VRKKFSPALPISAEGRKQKDLLGGRFGSSSSSSSANMIAEGKNDADPGEAGGQQNSRVMLALYLQTQYQVRKLGICPS